MDCGNCFISCDKCSNSRLNIEISTDKRDNVYLGTCYYVLGDEYGKPFIH
jgi:hypothetical protein